MDKHLQSREFQTRNVLLSVMVCAGENIYFQVNRLLKWAETAVGIIVKDGLRVCVDLAVPVMVWTMVVHCGTVFIELLFFEDGNAVFDRFHHFDVFDKGRLYFERIAVEYDEVGPFSFPECAFFFFFSPLPGCVDGDGL